MRSIVFALVTLACTWIPRDALAQSPPVVTSNPLQYVQDVSALMSRAGVGPIRDIYAQIYPSALPPNIEGTLITYERAIAGKQSRLSRVIDVASLADTFSSIYTYQYYGENLWLFTRFDFVRISETEWALSAVSFSSEWSFVALQTSPGFTSSPR